LRPRKYILEHNFKFRDKYQHLNLGEQDISAYYATKDSNMEDAELGGLIELSINRDGGKWVTMLEDDSTYITIYLTTWKKRLSR